MPKAPVTGKTICAHGVNLDSVQSFKTNDGIQREIQLPAPYFWRLVNTFEVRMAETQHRIEQLESQLKLNPTSEMSQSIYGGNNETMQMLKRILDSQHENFMRIAAHVAKMHEQVKSVKQEDLKKLQQNYEAHGGTGKARDPFLAADRVQAEEERRGKKGLSHPS